MKYVLVQMWMWIKGPDTLNWHYGVDVCIHLSRATTTKQEQCTNDTAKVL